MRDIWMDGQLEMFDRLYRDESEVAFDLRGI